MPSQPSKRGSRLSSVQHRRASMCSWSCIPWVFRVPQAKQLCGENSKVVPSARTNAFAGASDVKVLDLPGLGLDEVLARSDLLTHQHREDLVREGGVLQVDPQERPRLRVHRRLPELVGVHLAEPLEPLD